MEMSVMKKDALYKIFQHLPELETDRLTLRKMVVADAKDMFEYSCKEDVTKYLTWNPHKDIYYTEDYLRYIASRYRVGDYYDWAIEYKENKKMIGTCGFTRIDTYHDLAEIGFVLNPEYRGMELIPEAVKAVMKFGFKNLELHRIESRYILGNDASRRVMEKVGMQFEGVRRESMLIKGEYKDIGVCSILKYEFNLYFN